MLSSCLCSLLLSSKFGNLLGLLGKFLLVNLLLLGLGLFLLLFSALLGKLLNEEVVTSLDLVGLGASENNDSKEDHSEEEAGDRVPDEEVSCDDSKGENTPPVECLADPESEQATGDLSVVGKCVLIDTLIVGLVDRVISVTKSGESGGLSLLGIGINSTALHAN